MRITLFVALAVAALIPASVVAQGNSARETVRCSLNDGPERACLFTDQAGRNGAHRMTFTGPGIRVIFVGRANSGWWSGQLNGKTAMGFERNRGNTVFSTADLGTRFAWWYPSNAHGSY
ncbi:hypothetical protein E5A73_15575 [Sphingomonas gei]|uniref:SH3 domain-containing protein n=1 Tax=Sphingomonas gei TaxID=1395960 RepID=A0A4S1XAG6_9SPHN|nr:hypothetical protein [Sphingomonas gei]TGX52220.1 hypothetical protein E5A73_15575 [Sphingomonas gei]